MQRRHLMSLALVLVLLFAGGVAAEAVDFGYVKLTGKNYKKLREEQASLEKVIRSWKDGDVILRKETSVGVLVTQYTIVTIFAGDKTAIKAFLEKAPYEGDVLETLVVKALFNFDLRAKDEQGKSVLKGTSARGLVPRFKDPREFVKIVDQKTITAVLEKMVLFMNKDAVNAASGLQDLKYYQNPKAAMKLYANKLRPELFLLEWKGLGYTREERLRVPPGWADMKDVTLEESEDFINNLDLSPRK